MKITTTWHDWSRNSWFVGSGNDGSGKNCSTRRSVRKHTRQFLRRAWEGWVGCSNHWGRNGAPRGPWSPLVFLLAGMESARFLQIWWTETKTKNILTTQLRNMLYLWWVCGASRPNESVIFLSCYSRLNPQLYKPEVLSVHCLSEAMAPMYSGPKNCL